MHKVCSAHRILKAFTVRSLCATYLVISVSLERIRRQWSHRRKMQIHINLKRKSPKVTSHEFREFVRHFDVVVSCTQNPNRFSVLIFNLKRKLFPGHQIVCCICICFEWEWGLERSGRVPYALRHQCVSKPSISYSFLSQEIWKWVRVHGFFVVVVDCATLLRMHLNAAHPNHKIGTSIFFPLVCDLLTRTFCRAIFISSCVPKLKHSHPNFLQMTNYINSPDRRQIYVVFRIKIYCFSFEKCVCHRLRLQSSYSF